RAKGAGEWNHYRVEAKDGVLKLAVNGKVVSGVSRCRPRKGYLALEAEGSECRFRNLKIKELPTSNPMPEEVCEQAKDFVSLFTGLDLRGWKTSEEGKRLWKALPGPNALRYEGGGDAKAALTTTGEYANLELQLDCKLPKRSAGKVLLLG